jgi:hypothetical protein
MEKNISNVEDKRVVRELQRERNNILRESDLKSNLPMQLWRGRTKKEKF